MFGDIIGAKSLNTTERVRHRSDTGCVDRLDLLDHGKNVIKLSHELLSTLFGQIDTCEIRDASHVIDSK